MAVSGNFRPTMLVGVGGTGSRIAEQILGQALESDAELGNWIRLMVLDTDKNDLDKLKNVPEQYRYQFSRPETVYRMLERNSDVEGDWCYRRGDPEMSEVILGKTLVEGAGQIRFLTRLALHDSFVHGSLLNRLEAALSSLTVHDDAQRYGGSVHVLMLGSLAGATGSGSFAQLALAIKQAARNRDINATVRGVFLLPDVYARSGTLPTSQVPNVLANGYAALKELNAINVRAQLPRRKAKFRFEYLPRHDLQDGSTPFEAITFIDYENTTGGSMGRNLGAYVDMAARAGYLMVFSPLGASYGSGAINDVRQQLAAAAGGSTNLYSGIGVSAIRYPRDSMHRYLGRKLVLENLKGDWTRLDQDYRNQVERYRQEQAAGATAQEEPEKAASYIRGLEQLATEEPRLPFFRQSYSYLFPEVEDEKTREVVVRPRHKTFLDSLIDHVGRMFWDSDDTKSVRRRGSMDRSSLLESDSLVDTVRSQEATLDRDFRVLEGALQNRPDDIYYSTLASAEQLGRGEWALHHLQAHIVEAAPHPVTVRAFLYHLRSEILARRAAIDTRELRLRLFRIANVFRDDEEVQSTNNRPAVRSTPRVVDAATRADEAGGAFGRLFQGRKKAFAEEYVDYFNNSLTSMRNYANAVIEAKTLDQTLAEVTALIRAFEGLFVEIEDVSTTLAREIEAEITPYEDSRSYSGDTYIYANRACKEDAWRRLSERSFGLKLDAEVNRQLILSVYEKHRSDKRDRKPSSYSEIRALFWSSVVQGFGQAAVDDDFASVFDFSVIEAMLLQFRVEDRVAEAEAAKERKDPPRPLADDERMRRIVDRAATQSQPYLSFSRPESDGTPIKFWTIHPDCEAALNDATLFKQLFRSSDGDRPIVEGEFSPQELICVNLRVNVELTHLSKLSVSEAGATSVHARTDGRMWQAYQDLVARMLDRDRASHEGAEITPHVDRTWHVPGVLPEIFVDMDARIDTDNAKAFAVSWLHGLIRLEREHKHPVAWFSTLGHGLRNGADEEIVDTHDPWAVYQAFTANAPLTRAALEFWEAIRERGPGGAEGHPSFAKLTDPDRLLGLLQPAAIRNRNTEERDQAVKGLISAWIGLVRELVAAQETALTSRAQKAAAQDHVDAVRVRIEQTIRNEFEPTEARELDRLIARAYDDAVAAG